MGADEERHAELAWRVVAWALRSSEAAVVEALAAARDEVLEELAAFPPGAPSTAGHGGLRAAVLRDVVLPCVAALLDAPRGLGSPERFVI